MCGLLQANIMFVDKYLPWENIAIFLALPEIESRCFHYIACIINISVVRFELCTIDLDKIPIWFLGYRGVIFILEHKNIGVVDFAANFIDIWAYFSCFGMTYQIAMLFSLFVHVLNYINYSRFTCKNLKPSLNSKRARDDGFDYSERTNHIFNVY